MTPTLSIIVLSWNVRELLRACLVSVQQNIGKLERANVETLVIDNASTDGSAEMVAAEFPDVRLIRNAANVGFAAGNNIGIAASAGRYVLLLNSDTLVPPGTLETLVAFMEAHPQTGACSPRLLRPDGTPQPYAFGRDPTLGYLVRRGLNRLLFHRPLHNWATTDVLAVDWVSGACLMARREAIEQIGGLNEQIFMYFEDNDWCLRMRQAGWKVYFNPLVEITHIGGQSVARNPAARAAYYRSLGYFYERHYGPMAQGVMRIALAGYRLKSRLRAK
jgi:N-acetylglucosaminyl-diphospho-decaprenol L-rhamnosyltransferase